MRTALFLLAGLLLMAAALILAKLLSPDIPAARPWLLGLAFAGLEGPPESGTQDAAPADSHAFVEVLTTLDRIIVGPDSPAVVPIRVRVRPGYHVNAAVPAALIPM